MIKQYETINTFSRTPVPAQIITYFVFIGEALTFFICMYVNYSHLSKKIAIITLYILTMILQIVLTLITSCADPSDDVMIEYRNNPGGRYFIGFIQRRNMNVENCLYCDICTSYVKQTSRHCKVCQRCVQKFDHHCMWINNCIGQKNYAKFMAMTIVTFLNLVVYIVGMVMLWTENEWGNYLGSMVTVWVYSILVSVFALLLLNLIGLHFYLISKGITTYQFIIMQREEEAKKKQEEMQEQSRHQQPQPEHNQSNLPVTGISQAQHQSNQPRKTLSNQRGQQQQNTGSNQIISVGVIRDSSVHHASTKHENTNQVIFGLSVNENEVENNRTQKSDEMNDQHGEIRQKGHKKGPSYDNQNDEPSSLGSKAENQENISNYFTKNKSLKFFIGDQIGSRPKSTRNNEISSKQKLFKSNRAIESEVKKQVLFQSENKYRDKMSSLETKQEKQIQKIQVMEFQQSKGGK